MLKTVHLVDTPYSHLPLKPLSAWDEEKRARWGVLNTPQPNGIACPQCGAECQEIAAPSASVRGTKTEPPKWRMSCSGCAWVGYRVAC